MRKGSSQTGTATVCIPLSFPSYVNGILFVPSFSLLLYQQIGALLSLAKDPKFEASVAAGEWVDNSKAKANSVFSLFNLENVKARKVSSELCIPFYFSPIFLFSLRSTISNVCSHTPGAQKCSHLRFGQTKFFLLHFDQYVAH